MDDIYELKVPLWYAIYSFFAKLWEWNRFISFRQLAISIILWISLTYLKKKTSRTKLEKRASRGNTFLIVLRYFSHTAKDNYS